MKRAFFLITLLLIVVLAFVNKARQPQPETIGDGQATSSAKITAGEIAEVAFVIDGDTIGLTDGRRVRYIGIDAPEFEECFSQQAKEENKKIVENKSIRLEKDVSDKDSYGRLLRYVYVNTVFVNEELVEGGFARAWNVSPDEKYKDELFVAQQEARGVNRGLWQLCR